MSSRDPHLEVLINRYLDGEITAREMEDLRTRVDSDGQAKDLFDQMQQLHRSCQDTVQTYVLRPGRPVEDLIAIAWQGHKSHVWVGRVRRVVFSRFAAGMAAGLLLGVFVHLAISSYRPAVPASGGSPEAGLSSPVTALTADGGLTGRAAAVTEDLSSQDTLRQADYYTFTDREGNHWVIEGLSEERAQPVAYEGF